jgi:pimeloyl-ACP methyl ester carboxylesterase
MSICRASEERTLLLKVRTWGNGPRTALLVHGFTDDAETWWQVGPLVAELGFTVLAPDLRGHGHSPRGASYTFHDFADDLVTSLPAEADLALGHSLGAIVLGLAAPRLRPRRAVFVDPAWLRARGDVPLDTPLPSDAQQLPAGWSAQDVAVDLASNERTDPAIGPALMANVAATDMIAVPPAVHPGAVVLVPELAPALPLSAHDAVMAAGYEILTQPGVGHVMHRDDLAGFMELLRPQLVEGGVLA